MKKSVIAIFTILAFPFCIYGQSQYDSKGLMDRIAKKLQTYTSVKTDFSFTLSNPEQQINDTRDGSLFLNGDKYRLNIMGILAICDGTTLWTINEELKEANIIDPEDNDMFNPKSIFTLYEKDLKYEPVSAVGDKVIIDLLPMGIDESYSKIRMELIKSKEQIDKVIYYSKDGNQYVIKLKTFATNIPADNKTFVFDAKQFPGVKVFDMR